MRGFLIIRHAIAEDRDIAEENNQKDEDRALTKKGKTRMAEAARGLKVIVPELAHVATSPLLRAVQTAGIICKEYRGIRPITADVLRPGLDFHQFADWAHRLPESGITALVGHEPDLSTLVSMLLSGQERSFLHFKKGGACLIETPETFKAGNGRMIWFVTPRQLRSIGETG